MWQIRAILITMAGALFLLLASEARADGLQLKNGNFVQGKYLGGTERAVQFEVNGRIHLYGIGEILSINFGSADGIPSSSVEPKASANTDLHFTAGDKVEIRAALLTASKSGKTAQPILWSQEESTRSNLRAEPQSSRPAESPNLARRTRWSENPGQAKGILRPRFAFISD